MPSRRCTKVGIADFEAISSGAMAEGAAVQMVGERPRYWSEQHFGHAPDCLATQVSGHLQPGAELVSAQEIDASAIAADGVECKIEQMPTEPGPPLVRCSEAWSTSLVGCGGILSVRSGKLANVVKNVGWVLADRKIRFNKGAPDDTILIDHERRRYRQHPLRRAMAVTEVVTLARVMRLGFVRDTK